MGAVRRRRPRLNRTDKFVLGIAGSVLLVVLATIGATAYVVIHFVAKWW